MEADYGVPSLSELLKGAPATFPAHILCGLSGICLVQHLPRLPADPEDECPLLLTLSEPRDPIKATSYLAKLSGTYLARFLGPLKVVY